MIYFEHCPFTRHVKSWKGVHFILGVCQDLQMFNVWVGCRGHIGSIQKKHKQLWVCHVCLFGLHRFRKTEKSGRNCPFWVPSSFGVTHPASWEITPAGPHPSQPTVNPNGSIGRSRRLIAHRLAVGFTFANGFQEMILETTQPRHRKKSWAFFGCSKTIRIKFEFLKFNLNACPGNINIQVQLKDMGRIKLEETCLSLGWLQRLPCRVTIRLKWSDSKKGWRKLQKPTSNLLELALIFQCYIGYIYICT